MKTKNQRDANVTLDPMGGEKVAANEFQAFTIPR
jgi:hypothetical protein